MALVSKYGAWDEATYPWTDQTSAGLIGSVVTEFDAWITAISGNASIVANGQLPVKKRDQNSSTNGGTTNGFVYEFPDTTIGVDADGPTYPHLGLFGTKTSVSVEVGDQYQDDTQNSGYGNWANTPGHVSQETYPGDTGYSNQAIVIYDDTDGEEFFTFGMKMGAGNADEISFGAFKDTDGRWCFIFVDEAFCYDNTLQYWNGELGPYDTDPSIQYEASYFAPLRIRSGTTSGASGHPNNLDGPQYSWYPKNERLYCGRGSNARFGHYRTMSGGRQLMVLSDSGISVVI